MKKGGAAKGELVLAMYELANSFRHGWGVEKDPVAARSYYETAANLGDTDAMNEVARCYEEGFGGKKDRVSGSCFCIAIQMNGVGSIGELWRKKASYMPSRGLTPCLERLGRNPLDPIFQGERSCFGQQRVIAFANRRMIA